MEHTVLILMISETKNEMDDCNVHSEYTHSLLTLSLGQRHTTLSAGMQCQTPNGVV